MKTKNSKFSRILVILMIVALMIPAFGSAAYAESNTDSTGPFRTPAGYVISFSAINNVQALADVFVTSSGYASSITSKITLQSAPLGSSSYSNVTGVLPSTYTGKRFVKGVFSKQSHSSPWKQHITGFPRGIFRKFHNLYLSANPSIYGYVISLPFIFAYSAKLLRAFAKPTISDSFNVQITDSHSLIHFFVRFICSSEI